jgi:hypothetical protein
MANKRIFVAFAIEDQKTKILFTGQAKNERVPYEFIDMSVKEPWDSNWKSNCRTKIKGCDGVIVLVSRNLRNAAGALWEAQCAIEERVPIIGIYIDGANIFDRPYQLVALNCYDWTWANVKRFC